MKELHWGLVELALSIYIYTHTHTNLGGETEVDEFFDAPEGRAHASLRGQQAKLVSVILFSGSVVSMCVVFVKLGV